MTKIKRVIVHNSTFIQPLGTFVHEYGYLSPHLCIVNEAKNLVT